MKSMRLLLSTALLGVVVACGSPEPEPPPADEPSTRSAPPAGSSVSGVFTFRCDDGLAFVARIDADTARLSLPEGSVSLPHVPAAPGGRYEGDGVVFWNKGREATLEVEGRSRTCRTGSTASEGSGDGDGDEVGDSLPGPGQPR